MKTVRIIAPFSLSAVLFILSYLSSKDTNSGLFPILLLIIGLIVAMAFTVALAGFYLTRRRKKQKGTMEQAKKPELPLIESEAQKIVKILQSSGGSNYQSAITDQTKFSKAKVSLLLSELEKKGVVTRYKKGRDKIVTLVEKGKGER